MTMTVPKHANYEFLEQLGAGAFGDVWKARHKILNQLRAIKVLRPADYTSSNVKALLNEARSMSEFENHPYLVKVYDAIDGASNCFVIMQYITGGDLLSHIKGGATMPWHKACRYIHQAAIGLQGLHKLGFVHCDIKPNNILLDNDGDCAVLGDLGLVAPHGQADIVQVLPSYAAPEVMAGGDYQFASDVYSLGASLFHLVTGRRIDTCGNLSETLESAGLPQPVSKVILGALNPDPAQRDHLTRFTSGLWDTCWLPVRELLDRRCRALRPAVRLLLETLRNDPHNPSAFVPFSETDYRSQRLKTGTLLRLNCVANAEGFLTTLVFDSSGCFRVGFPNVGQPNCIKSGDLHSLTFTLTPPDGSVSFYVIWHRSQVSSEVDAWREWLEDRRLKVRVRGAEIIDHHVTHLIDEAFVYQHVAITHGR